jgi:hypothetical protein
MALGIALLAALPQKWQWKPPDHQIISSRF